MGCLIAATSPIQTRFCAEMPGKCHWVIGLGTRCCKEAKRSHNLPKKGETWANATGERSFACTEHYYRKPRMTANRGVQVFKNDADHTAWFIESLQADPEVFRAWNGGQVLPP